MTSIKFISILIIMFSILVLGCIDQKTTGTPVPTVSPTPTKTIAPTIIPTIVTPVPTPIRISVTYKSFVDADFGFYKVVATNASVPVMFDPVNRTLSINEGDDIIFVNLPRGDTSDVLTIISAEGLWDNATSRLPQAYKQFNHTFNGTGTFTVFVKEFKKVTPLKIMVTS